MLPLSFRIARANVKLPLQYLTKLPIPLYGHIDFTAK